MDSVATETGKLLSGLAGGGGKLDYPYLQKVKWVLRERGS